MANAVDCTSRPGPLYEVLALWGVIENMLRFDDAFNLIEDFEWESWSIS